MPYNLVNPYEYQEFLMSLTQSKEVNSLSKRYSTHIERRITRTVMVGDVAIGSDYPVRVQSMINEDTMDVENAYLAIRRLHDVGCEIVLSLIHI